jgi:release factor glutamine methyltransferase
VAVDRSREALRVAQRNLARNGVSERVSLLQGDLLSASVGPFGLVCANLPYIPRRNLIRMPVARHEPLLALDGGEDGLDLIRELLAGAPRWLARGGAMLLEMQSDQGETIRQFARECLPGAHIHLLPDLASRPRLVEITSA